MMENREKMDAGNSQFARTRTSRVPRTGIRINKSRKRLLRYHRELHRSNA
jgi:hypothetical protein